MRAVGYFREAKSRTLAEQSEAFLDFCNHNGFEAAATFLDTKTDQEQHGFRQMVDFIRQQEGRGFLIVVLPDLVTLGNSPVEAMRRYFQIASLGISVTRIDTGADVAADVVETWSTLKASGGVGDRVKAAMRRKAVKGEALGRPPYGYRVGPQRRLIIVAEEGAVVRYIFRLYLKDGLGIRRIARRLNEDGLRTRRDGLWSMVTVRDILRNRAYVGTYSRFGVRVPASHAPLISQADFQRVQERLDERRPSGSARQVSPFLLSGLLYCGHCGNKMIGVTRKQKWQRGDGSIRSAQYRYYQCESRTNRSLCDYHTQRAEELEERVKNTLMDTTLVVSRNGHVPNIPQNGVNRLRDRVRRLDKRLEQYLDSAASGSLNTEKLQTAAIALATQQLQLEDKLVEAARVAHLQETEEERRRYIESTLRKLREAWDDLAFEEKQEQLRQGLERINITDDAVELVPRA